MVPTARAIIGVPKNFKMSFAVPDQPAIDAIELAPIKRIGMRIGASAINPFGSFPYSATSSS